MRKRDVYAVIIFLVVGLAGGVWYYFRIQHSVVPVTTDTTTTGQRSSSPQLKPQTVIEGLSNVWDVAFLPDETMLFTERSGTISIVKDGKKVVVHEVEDVYATGEGGLLGMTVDPDFTANRFVYACYDTAQDIRVSRWKVSDDVTALTEQTDIVTGLPVNTTTYPGRHSGCRPRFDTEKHLWIGTGDVAIGTTPQDPKSLGGKILRVTRDGLQVDGNLGAPFDSRIFSYGHRNVQGLALFDKPVDGSYGYGIEHGSSRDDEINPLVSNNFGRDPVPGYTDSVPMTDKERFPNAIEAVWSSGASTIAPSGATIIKGGKWGIYQGRLMVAILKAQHLRLFEFDVTGKKVIDEKQFFKDDFGRIRSVVMGPKEDMYITTDNGGGNDKIIKISPR